MTKLDAAKVSVTASIPDSYHFTNIRLKVGIYKIFLRAFILIAINFGIADSWDNFAQFGTNYQWFHPPIHPAFMQRPSFLFQLRRLRNLEQKPCINK